MRHLSDFNVINMELSVVDVAANVHSFFVHNRITDLLIFYDFSNAITNHILISMISPKSILWMLSIGDPIRLANLGERKSNRTPRVVADEINRQHCVHMVGFVLCICERKKMSAMRAASIDSHIWRNMCATHNTHTELNSIFSSILYIYR